MLSNTYQQSSAFNADAAKVDPENKLLWRYNRHRLEGEVDSRFHARRSAAS